MPVVTPAQSVPVGTLPLCNDTSKSCTLPWAPPLVEPLPVVPDVEPELLPLLVPVVEPELELPPAAQRHVP
jgi:hypothetical protein